MAVEIPVYVDIQGAFDRAVRAIPKEMPKLEDVLSRYVLNIKIDYGGGGFKTVRNILTDTTMDANELEFALKRVKKAYDEAVAKNVKSKTTSGTVNGLAKAYGLLEQRAKGFYNSNAVAAMRLDATIAKVTYKIQTLRGQLSTLSAGSDQYNKINYELQIQTKRLAELTAQQMKYKAGIDASTSAYRKQSGVVKQLAGYFSGLYAAHTLIRFVKQVRDVTGELEYQRVALGHLLQDEAFGNELFAKTIEAAKESPFRIGQLVTYTKQLAAYRIEQENLFDTTQRLADISAGLGVDMNRLILAYGQVRAASVLRGQELRQFTEAGIPLVDLLAEKFRKLGREGTTTADVFKLISERAVPFEYIKEIFEELTDAGGQFYKMQETQAKTLQGRWEKLKDAYDQALMKIGETDTFQSMNDKVLDILNGLAKNLNTVVRAINAGSIAWAAYWLATKSGLSYGVRLTALFLKEYGVVKTLTFGIGGLTAAFKKLWAAMKANWVGLAVSALAGIITYFTTFKNKTKEATEGLSDMQKAIESMKVANEKLNFEKNLISKFESISKITEKTAANSEQLSTAIEELKRSYPNLADKIGNANVPLAEQVGLLQDAADKAHALAVEEAKSRLDTQEQLIRGLEDEMNAAKQAREIAEMRKREAEAAEKRGPVVDITDFGEYYEEKSAKQLKEETIAAAKAAKAADDAYEQIATTLATARREAEQLRKLAFPEDAKKNMAEWQNLLIEARQYVSEGISKELFTESDVKSWDSLGDAIKKLKPMFEEAQKTYKGLVSAVNEGGDYVRPALIRERDASKETLDAWVELNKILGGLLSKKQSGGSSYAQDPYIKQMQERMKFMKDFKKGYDELRKYMSKSDALGKEAGVMLTRGLSLGIDTSEQRRAAEDLSNWYEDTYNAAFDYLKKSKGVSGTMQEFLSRQITGNTNRDKMLKDFQSLIQSLFDAKTDFDTAQIKKNIEDSLKRVTEDIKRSETARNFYNNILELTGDENLAATMSVDVYGGIGNTFKERMQQQLNAALATLDTPDLNLWEKLWTAGQNQDFDTLLAHISEFPEEWQKMLRQMAADSQKFSADRAADLIKSLKDAKTYSEKRVEIARQSAKRIAEIEEMSIDDASKEQLRRQNAKKESEELAKLQYDAFKETPMYVELFADLDRATSRMVSNMRENLVAMKGQWTDLPPTELKEIQSRINELDSQLAKRNPFKALINSIKEYRRLNSEKERIQVDEEALWATKNAATQKQLLEIALKELDAAKEKYGATSDEAAIAEDNLNVQKEATDEAIEQANAAQEISNNYREAAKHIEDAAEALKNWEGYVNTSLDGIQDIVETFASTEDIEAFSIAAEGISKTMSGAVSAASGVARVMAGDFSGIPEIIKGVGSVIAGTFGAANEMKIKRIDREIKEQDELIKDLEASYSRLDKALSEAFGNEYVRNFNQMLTLLEAKARAYQAQADAERRKGKKADEATAKDYERSAQQMEDEIAQLRKDASSFFAGSDLAAAAESFADAWLSAYQEFGDTAGAIEERMEEMVTNIVKKAALSGIAQSVLGDWYASLADIQDWNAKVVAEKWQEAMALVGPMVDGMQNFANEMSTQGQSLRKTSGQFTGISRDIASASEESITGLAAGINTQNFYMQHIDLNVSAILATLTGGTSTAGASNTGEYVDPYKDQMLLYVGALPQMRDEMAAIRSLLDKVIKPVGTPSSHRVIIG